MRLLPRTLVVLAMVVGAIVAACGREAEHRAPDEVPTPWEVARTAPGHVKHLGKQTSIDGAARAIECKDCHQKEGFASPGAAPCARCHGGEEKKHHLGSAASPTLCTTCHVFRPHDGSLAEPTCAGCHAKPQGKLAALEHHVDAKAACTTCHAPHEKTKPPATCTTCHTEVQAAHGSATTMSSAGPSSAEPAICTTCHAPHRAGVAAKDGCPTCHVAPPKTGPIAESSAMMALAASAPKVKPGSGVAGAPDGREAHACTTCHAPHMAKKEQVLACASCHEAKKAITASAGHATCTGCHTPHAPNGAASSCTKCHAGHDALGASGIASHAKCTSCHDVHAPSKPPSAACAGCHDGVHPTHPSANVSAIAAWKGAPAKERACVGCHAPHPTKPESVVAECTSCHGKVAPKDSALHAEVACVNCHRPHLADEDRSAAPWGFALAGAKAAFCGGCHTAIAPKVAKGHAECLSCHESAHAPKKDVACGGCHEQEEATAPKGHQSCQSCHEPHGGALHAKDGKAASPGPAFCKGCHEKQEKAPHGNLAGGCATCHRPHGPEGPKAPPGCTTCHEKAKLPGLHLVTSHAQSCQSCHESHEAPSATRATCTGKCHTAQKEHQPEAKVCVGCHVFRK